MFILREDAWSHKQILTVEDLETHSATGPEWSSRSSLTTSSCSFFERTSFWNGMRSFSKVQKIRTIPQTAAGISRVDAQRVSFSQREHLQARFWHIFVPNSGYIKFLNLAWSHEFTEKVAINTISIIHSFKRVHASPEWVNRSLYAKTTYISKIINNDWPIQLYKSEITRNEEIEKSHNKNHVTQ